MSNQQSAIPGTRSWAPQFFFPKVLVTLLLLPLFYLSSVRFISQLIVPTDHSSLWEARAFTGKLKTQNATLNALTRLDPFSSTYHYLTARALMYPDQIDLTEKTGSKAAEKTIFNAIRLSTVEPEYWTLLGWLKGREGFLEEGFQQFERAIALNPGHPGSYIQEGIYLDYIFPYVDPERRLLNQQLTELNLNIALRLDSTFSSDPQICIVLASIYVSKRSPKQALQTLARIPAGAELDWPSMIKKWSLYFRAGNSYTPISEWNKISHSARPPRGGTGLIRKEITKYSEPDFKYMLASIYLQEGKPNQAFKELTSLVSLRKNVAEYRMALGDIYEKLGKSREALNHYEEALKLSPANQEAKKKVVKYYSGK